MHIINEDMDFFVGFMRDLGRRLKTALVLTKCRRMRQGRFTANSSLLLKDLKTLDPDVLANHMDMSDKCHSFESLQTDQGNVLLTGDGGGVPRVSAGLSGENKLQ